MITIVELIIWASVEQALVENRLATIQRQEETIVFIVPLSPIKLPLNLMYSVKKIFCIELRYKRTLRTYLRNDISNLFCISFESTSDLLLLLRQEKSYQKGRYKIAYKSVRDLLSARIPYVIVVHIFAIQLTIVRQFSQTSICVRVFSFKERDDGLKSSIRRGKKKKRKKEKKGKKKIQFLKHSQYCFSNVHD